MLPVIPTFAMGIGLPRGAMVLFPVGQVPAKASMAEKIRAMKIVARSSFAIMSPLSQVFPTAQLTLGAASTSTGLKDRYSTSVACDGDCDQGQTKPIIAQGVPSAASFLSHPMQSAAPRRPW